MLCAQGCSGTKQLLFAFISLLLNARAAIWAKKQWLSLALVIRWIGSPLLGSKPKLLMLIFGMCLLFSLPRNVEAAPTPTLQCIPQDTTQSNNGIHFFGISIPEAQQLQPPRYCNYADFRGMSEVYTSNNGFIYSQPNPRSLTCDFEPPRETRRLFGLSPAAIAV